MIREIIFWTIAIYFFGSFRKPIPKLHYGIVLFLNRYAWKVRGGLVFAPLGFCKIVTIPFEPESYETTVTVYTKESSDDTESSFALNITVSGTKRPDYKFLKRYWKWTSTITTDLGSWLASFLQGVVAELTLGDLLSKHKALEHLINCLLRLNEEKMPHLHGIQYGWREDVVETKEILDFYKSAEKQIDRDGVLKHEHENTDERSYAELRYGVDLLMVHIKAKTLSEETKKAIAAKKQAELKLRTAESRRKAAKDYKRDFPGLSDQDALIETAYDLGAPRDIHDVRGANGEIALWIEKKDGSGRNR